MLTRLLFAAVVLPLLAWPARAECPPRATPETHVFAGGWCLIVNTFGREQAGPSPTLVVVVHGDISDGGRATYHAAFAEKIARPDVVAVAITRPGYTDVNGLTSGGPTFGRSDNYTPAVVNAVGAAVATLRRHYQARRVVYVGHSGGAAIGGALIGRRPGLVDVAMLVSCPCDLAAWLRSRGRPLWTRSVSPSDVISRVPRSTQVIAITGANDVNTIPAVAEGYVTSLLRRGVPASFIAIESAEHGFFSLREAVWREVDVVLAQ